MPLLEVDNLRVARSKAFALHVPSLNVGAKKILCIAGPNGSGKTTFIDSLAGLLQPNEGTIRMNGVAVGENLKATKSLMGFVPDDEAWLIKELCAREYFAVLADVYRKAGITNELEKRITALAATLHFTAFEQPLEQLSHGNKKKVQIIAGLMHEPRIIVIDELRNGLDPIAIIAAERLLRDEAKRGACILAATHDLWWAERMADDVLLLIDGSPVVLKPKKEIVKTYGSIEQLFIQTVGLEQP